MTCPIWQKMEKITLRVFCSFVDSHTANSVTLDINDLIFTRFSCFYGNCSS